MSATIAALAISYRLYALMYVSGIRDDSGVVIKGTERPETIKPFRILFGNDIERIRVFSDISI